MTQIEQFPDDTPVQAFMEKIVADEILPLLRRYAAGDRPYSEMLKVKEGQINPLSYALENYMEDLAKRAERHFPETDKDKLAEDAERVVMRKVLDYLLEIDDRKSLRDALMITEATKERINRVIKEGCPLGTMTM